ncbi:MAG: hypothetical protein CUN55_07610, partial [Phototrophicales bacterium]
KVFDAEKEKDIPNKAWTNAEIIFTGGFLPPTTINTNVKWIHSIFSGVENILKDPFMLANPQIILTNSGGIHAAKIGEYVIGMMLALGHRIPLLLQHQARQEWSDQRYSLFMAQELGQSTVGILGYGRIGQEIARLCKAFGATVLATKRDVRHPTDERYHIEGRGDPAAEMVDRLYPPEATGFMIKECDFVVITLPLTDQTRGFFGEQLIQKMKSTAFLINVGRGGIVDEVALAKALQEGRLGGAAFDVFEHEPLPVDSPLWKAPNIIISPHISGNMVNYTKRAADIFIENLQRYLHGQPLLNVVNREKGY